MIKRYKWIWTCHRRLERLASREAILWQALGSYYGPPTTAPWFQRLYVGGESPQPWWSGPDPGEQLRGAHPLITETDLSGGQNKCIASCQGYYPQSKPLSLGNTSWVRLEGGGGDRKQSVNTDMTCLGQIHLLGSWSYWIAMLEDPERGRCFLSPAPSAGTHIISSVAKLFFQRLQISNMGGNNRCNLTSLGYC